MYGFSQSNIKPNKSNIKPVLHRQAKEKETHLIKVIFSKPYSNIYFPSLFSQTLAFVIF